MAEEIHIPNSISKKDRYESLIPQLRSLVEGEENSIANLSNLVAGLKFGMNYFWVGVYLAGNDLEKKELILGPFQGPVACTRIAFGKGVCGKAWEKEDTIIVENVDEFPGHISCNSASRSEIVVPIIKGSKVVGVLDVDSTELSDFNEVDKKYLEEISLIISGVL